MIIKGLTDREFRIRLREWFDVNPAQVEPMPARMGNDYPTEYLAQQRQWQKRLAGAGLAGIAWPVEYGGQGAPGSCKVSDSGVNIQACFYAVRCVESERNCARQRQRKRGP
jgi:alkylation response protein AidB-like acyl-CoA dehydrogenase